MPCPTGQGILHPTHMPEYRTLRCANAQLYTGASLLVLGAAIYVLCCKDALWQQVTAVLAAVITPLWAAHYAALRYTVDSTGVTRRSLLGTTTLRWDSLTSATLRETQTQATESCSIDLQAGEQIMTLSSDLLPLDDVKELAAELRQLGILH